MRRFPPDQEDRRSRSKNAAWKGAQHLLWCRKPVHPLVPRLFAIGAGIRFTKQMSTVAHGANKVALRT